MTLDIDLTGRVALVTGGAKGVGRGISTRLLDAGATVVVCGRNRPDDLPVSSDVARSVVDFRVADVRDPEAVQALLDQVVAAHGRIDVAVNNAGGTPVVPAAEASPRFSESIVRLNLLSALYVATAAYHHMLDQPEGGTIVNVTSLSGMRPSPGSAAYGAAKAGLINLTTSLAMEWAPKVRINCVSAGMVRTEGFEAYYGGSDGAAAVAATVPMGRVAEPTDVGDAVAFLASSRAAFISGANLVVHGGGERLAFNEVH